MDRERPAVERAVGAGDAAAKSRRTSTRMDAALWIPSSRAHHIHDPFLPRVISVEIRTGLTNVSRRRPNRIRAHSMQLRSRDADCSDRQRQAGEHVDQIMPADWRDRKSIRKFSTSSSPMRQTVIRQMFNELDRCRLALPSSLASRRLRLINGRSRRAST